MRALLSLILLFAFVLLFTVTLAQQTRPSDNQPITLKIYEDNYVVVPTGNPEKHIRYRLSYASDTIYLYYQNAESSDSRTWDAVTRYVNDSQQTYYTEILYPGNIRLRLPVTYSSYAYYYDEDPQDTGGRIAHQGVLGMGPASPFKLYWRRYSLSRHKLVLGAFAHGEQDSNLPFVFERGTTFTAEIDINSVAGDSHAPYILRAYSRNSNITEYCRNDSASGHVICTYLVVFDPSVERSYIPHEILGHAHEDPRKFSIRVFSKTNDPYEYRNWDDAVVEALCGAYIEGSANLPGGRMNMGECEEKARMDIQIRIDRDDASLGLLVDTSQTIPDHKARPLRVFVSQIGLEGDAARTIRIGRLSMRDFVYFRDEDRDFTIVAHAYDTNNKLPRIVISLFIAIGSIIYSLWYAGAYPYIHSMTSVGALSGLVNSTTRNYYTVDYKGKQLSDTQNHLEMLPAKKTGANPEEDFYSPETSPETIERKKIQKLEQRMYSRLRDKFSIDNNGTLVWFTEIWKTFIVLTLLVAIFGIRVDRFLDRIAGVEPAGTGFWPSFGFYLVPVFLFASCGLTSFLMIRAYPMFFVSLISATICISICYFLLPFHRSLTHILGIYFFSILACSRISDYAIPLLLDTHGTFRMEVYRFNKSEYTVWGIITTIIVAIVACFYSYFGAQALFTEFWPSHPSMPFIIIANIAIAWLVPCLFYYAEERYSLLCARVHRTKDTVKKQYQRELAKHTQQTTTTTPPQTEVPVKEIPVRRIGEEHNMNEGLKRRAIYPVAVDTSGGPGSDWTIASAYTQ